MGQTPVLKKKASIFLADNYKGLPLQVAYWLQETASWFCLMEPTSSVDPRTEALIYDNLFEAFKDKAIISSLHRLHLLPKFDYIYILDKGKIVSEGTFDDLMESSRIFNEMWEHQRSSSIPILHEPKRSVA